MLSVNTDALQSRQVFVVISAWPQADRQINFYLSNVYLVSITLQVCEWSRNWWHLTHRWWWYGYPRPGCSQIVISPCCATWRRWAVGWSTDHRLYSTVSTSSGPFRSWLATGCLFLTPSPTVNEHPMFIFFTVRACCGYCVVVTRAWSGKFLL